MNKQVIVLIVIIALVALGYVLFRSTDATNEVVDEEHGHDDEVALHEIYPGDVADKIAAGEDIILLDVRTPEEYAGVHIENSILLPVQKLSQQTLADAGLGESAKDKEIIIYCRSGSRSKQAYDIMDSLGYTNITSVSGGIIHWQEDNYPYLETGEYDETVVATGDQSAEGGARIAFDKTDHNFGLITQSGGVVQTSFTVRNDGTENLEIDELSTSCGCTTAQLSANTIAPGDEVELTVFFDPNFHEEPEGEFKRTVFIPTNDPTMPEANITITVEIAKD